MLVLTVGLPGSGKTTAAKLWCAAAPRRVRLNRDDLREMFTGLCSSAIWALPEDERKPIEDMVTAAQACALDAALAAGWSVIVDDTNLHADRRTVLEDVARWHGVPVHYFDLRHVPVGQCIAQDAARARAGGRLVGRTAIERMAATMPVGPLAGAS